jgi:hypothetical protein
MSVAPAPALASSAPANLEWSPATSSGEYDFGVLDAGAGATETVTFTLTNSGGRAPGTIVVSLPQEAFAVGADGCTETSLGPGRSCEVTVTYAPSESGEVDRATLTATAEHGNASLALSGKAGSPSLAFSPASYDFGAVDVGATPTQTFTLTNSGGGTSESLTSSLSGSSAMSIAGDGCSGAELAPGAACEITIAYAPTEGGTDRGTLAAGGATAGLAGTGTAASLTAAIELTDCQSEVIDHSLNLIHAAIAFASEDNCLVAQVDNVPAAGVAYQWTMTTPNTVGYLFNPIQTTASVLLPAESVPDFEPEDVVVALTVTPKNGGAPATVSGRLLYRSSGMTVACNTQLEAAPPGLTPQASASTIPLAGSVTVTQSYVDNLTCGGVPLSGTVTYSADGQTLGTSTAPLEPFVIQGSSLGVGSHTVTVTYAIWNGVAYAPYSVELPIEVTP